MKHNRILLSSCTMSNGSGDHRSEKATYLSHVEVFAIPRLEIAGKRGELVMKLLWHSLTELLRKRSAVYFPVETLGRSRGSPSWLPSRSCRPYHRQSIEVGLNPAPALPAGPWRQALSESPLFVPALLNTDCFNWRQEKEISVDAFRILRELKSGKHVGENSSCNRGETFGHWSDIDLESLLMENMLYW